MATASRPTMNRLGKRARANSIAHPVQYASQHLAGRDRQTVDLVALVPDDEPDDDIVRLPLSKNIVGMRYLAQCSHCCLPHRREAPGPRLRRRCWRCLHNPSAQLSWPSTCREDVYLASARPAQATRHLRRCIPTCHAWWPGVSCAAIAGSATKHEPSAIRMLFLQTFSRLV